MKILSEEEYYTFHPAIGIVCLILGLILVGLVISLIFTAFKEGQYELFLASIFFTAMSFVMFMGFNVSLDHKMTYECKATITDFNEVYDKGYEIVDHEGEIYTLVKSEK